MTDLCTALYAHGAILAALVQRGSTGEGQWLQCNLLATQVAAGGRRESPGTPEPPILAR